MSATEKTMTAAEAARTLGLSDVNYVQRLLRSGSLAGRRDGRVWIVDAESVERRRLRMAQRAGSRVNAAAERERRKREVAARFT